MVRRHCVGSGAGTHIKTSAVTLDTSASVSGSRFPTTPTTPARPSVSSPGHIPPTVTNIKAGLESIMDLKECEVDDTSSPGWVTITIKKYGDYIYRSSNWKRESKLVFDDAIVYMQQTMPAGVVWDILDGTPIFLLDLAVREFKTSCFLKVTSPINAHDFVINYLVGKKLGSKIDISQALSTSTAASGELTFRLRRHGGDFYQKFVP